MSKGIYFQLIHTNTNSRYVKTNRWEPNNTMFQCGFEVETNFTSNKEVPLFSSSGGENSGVGHRDSFCPAKWYTRGKTCFWYDSFVCYLA